MQRQSFRILFLILLLILPACVLRPRNLPVVPSPMMTLTFPALTLTETPDPGAIPNTSLTATPLISTATGEAGATAAATPVITDVKAVVVKESIRLRLGPGTDYDAVGLVHAGTTLTVTGRSEDNAWWQVECEQGPNAVCWVSADSELTEPAP